MREEVITSRSNPLCAHFRKLAASKAYREETGEMLCDSPKLLREAELWGQTILTILYTQGADTHPFQPKDTKVQMIQVTESVMESVSPMKTPQGVVFSCLSPSRRPPEKLEPGRYLVLDGVQDPGNVGTILRTADAFDWGEVFLLPGCADVNSPKTIRAAMGVHFRRSIYQCTLEELTALLKGAGVPLYAAALGEDTRDVRTVDLSSCAVVIGSEGQGVSEQVLERCQGTLSIPMSRRCESLNAAIAAGIVLWEGWRR